MPSPTFGIWSLLIAGFNVIFSTLLQPMTFVKKGAYFEFRIFSVVLLFVPLYGAETFISFRFFQR
ncbi:hypothetical protein C8Q75DRAFT_738138 [Abortiporus biennis]|nr:hypothetical protein C8Q75DRAFT_738138 [Abortiporus biennis]